MTAKTITDRIFGGYFYLTVGDLDKWKKWYKRKFDPSSADAADIDGLRYASGRCVRNDHLAP